MAATARICLTTDLDLCFDFFRFNIDGELHARILAIPTACLMFSSRFRGCAYRHAYIQADFARATNCYVGRLAELSECNTEEGIVLVD